MGCLCCQHHQFARRIACIQIEQRTGLSILAQAVATIRKFSKCKNKSHIMDSPNPIDVEGKTQFVNGVPKNLFIEVSKGVHKFHDFKK